MAFTMEFVDRRFPEFAEIQLPGLQPFLDTIVLDFRVRSALQIVVRSGEQVGTEGGTDVGTKVGTLCPLVPLGSEKSRQLSSAIGTG